MNSNFSPPNFNLKNMKTTNTNINDFENYNKEMKLRLQKQNLNNKSSDNKIIDVFEDNFITEIKNIGQFLSKYPYIGMDTEFPGVIYPCKSFTSDFYYKFTKENVDKLKLIQVGISLFDKNGEKPNCASTWQFNLKFDLSKDKIAQDAFTLLKNSGIDFDKLRIKGISHKLFAEYFISSGLLLNDEVTWISFNGFSDFAYLLNLATNQLMPENEEQFIRELNMYFPNVYDIKKMINDNERFKGGLNKIAYELNIERFGEMHQAGSDSMVTGDVLFTLLKGSYLSLENIENEKNVLFGIGLGADNNETITYTKFITEPDTLTYLNMINGGNTNSNNTQFSKPYNNNNFLGPMCNAMDAIMVQNNII